MAIPPSQLPRFAIAGSTTAFAGFDRGPYLASFESGAFRFALLNVHLFYGSEAPVDLDRRTMETFAVAWWADKTHRDENSYSATSSRSATSTFRWPPPATGSSTRSSHSG